MISPRIPAALLAAAFALAACTGGAGRPPGGDPSSAGPVSEGAVSEGAVSGGPVSGGVASPGAPPELTPEAYEIALEAPGGPLGTAVGDIAKARTIRSLKQRIGRARDAADAAAGRLSGVRPPADIGPEHADYLTALRGVGDRLGALGDAVDGRSLCTGPAVLARLGTSDEFAALKEAGADLAGGGDYRGGIVTVKPPAERARRLGNGTILRSAVRGGYASLTVKNGNPRDGVVTLLKGRTKALSFYVRKKSTAKIGNIRDGTYHVYFTTGADYDRSARLFTRDCAFQRFDDTMRFHTSRVGSQIRWTDWRLTLNRTAGGNAKVDDVDPDDFPS
ncbi:hypothetical protein GCM10009530_57590 [Microbispora corallina]|uniref:Lipoprotein n=1 Tax=Microbispora corallina TaxID=83302 RepID=A0ABQ4G3X3_9ACTN|nr:hypothetical protein [Microbispora corallina]GIH41703.1 hypothetical protein Mco01_47030 [Microbispora corallina]